MPYSILVFLYDIRHTAYDIRNTTYDIGDHQWLAHRHRRRHHLRHTERRGRQEDPLADPGQRDGSGGEGLL
jgi:hypothetical protein